MADALAFSNRKMFRRWLEKHGADSGGVWLLFGKKGGPPTLTAHEALEEALCFGWIDGQMRRLDEYGYKKYFARRTAKSNWSEKNKKLAMELIDKESMSQAGFAAIETAKKNGCWESPKSRADDGQIDSFILLVKSHEPAYGNLMAMPLSIRRTYAMYYFDAKMDKTRQARLEKIIDRLNRNLKPM